ncbi:MAG: hypothetical protein HC875_29480 [Anaerolineales bacterium]|nr:hypothetical protein [Anaerolineales bacterium]
MPDGFDELPDEPGSSNYQTRKCKISNLVHQGVVAVVTKLAAKASEIAAAKTMAHALGIAFMITVLSIAFGEVLTPVPVIDAIFIGALGLAVSMAAYLIGQDVLFTPLLAALTDRQTDLVCALYQATNVGEAKADYQAVLVDEGVNSITAGITGVIISANWGALLFADVQGYGEALDAQLSAYEGPVDCNSCDPCPVLYDVESDWSAWSSVDASTNSGSSTGTITDKLSYTVTIASSPSGASLAQRRFVVPLAEVVSEGWSPGIGATITVQIDGDGPGVVGHWIWVNYDTDPQQFSGSTVLANANGSVSVELNSNDTITSIWIVAGNSRSSGSSTSNNSGKFTSVEFCNA